MKLKSSPYVTVLTVFTVLTTTIMMSACKPSGGWFEPPQTEWQDISESGLPKFAAQLPRLERTELSIVTKAVAFDKEADLVSSSHALESFNLEHSQTMAGESRNTCPKVISKQVDANTIEHKHEVLAEDYCDYYVYPEKGQTINVQSQPSNMVAQLVSPVRYDFANGSYQVKQADKYVIRLGYKGSEYRSRPLDYDVTVTIQ